MTVRRVSPQEAAALMREEGYAYVDVRSIPEFEAGHPAGAYNIPLMHSTPSGLRPNGDFISLILAVFPKDTKLVIGCKMGGRSLRAAQILIDAGYEHVVDQRAGFHGMRDAFGQIQEAGWQSVGLEVCVEARPDKTYEAISIRKDT
jgi:rhodanese-related sulfurtransferase